MDNHSDDPSSDRCASRVRSFTHPGHRDLGRQPFSEGRVTKGFTNYLFLTESPCLYGVSGTIPSTKSPTLHLVQVVRGAKVVCRAMGRSRLQRGPGRHSYPQLKAHRPARTSYRTVLVRTTNLLSKYGNTPCRSLYKHSDVDRSRSPWKETSETGAKNPWETHSPRPHRRIDWKCRRTPEFLQVIASVPSVD